jgi:uncharacterized protein (DUF983 family)
MRDGVGLGQALLRGLNRKCPCCGRAPAFRGYLKIVDACPSCQTPLSLYPTDDGPAYITIILVGHLIIAPAFMFGIFYTYPAQVLVPVLVGGIGALTLLALPFIKGAFLGLMWYLGLKQAR